MLEGMDHLRGTSVVLGLFVATWACTDSATSGVVDGGVTSGAGTGGASGAAGSVAGGDSGTSNAGFSVSRTGSTVFLKAPNSVWFEQCLKAVSLVRRGADAGDFQPLRDQRPQIDLAGYYLDDRYVKPECGLGCDNVVCGRLGDQQLAAVEYVLVDPRPAPVDADNCTGAGGGGGDDGGTPVVPAVESRMPEGALAVKIVYYDDAACSVRRDLTLPVE
jgi:hypothetical protein